MATLYILDYQKRSSFEHYHPINSSHSVLNVHNEGAHPPGSTHLSKTPSSIVHFQGHTPLSSRSGASSQGTKLYSKVFQKQPWGAVAKHPLRPEASSTPRVKPAILGRPDSCPVYLNLSPCKVRGTFK